VANWLVEAGMIETAATAVVVVAADSRPVGGEGEELEIGGTVAATEKARVVEIRSTTATHPEVLIRIAIHRHHRRTTTPHTMAQHSSQPYLQVVHMDQGCFLLPLSLKQQPLHRRCMAHRFPATNSSNRRRRVTLCTPRMVQPLLPHPLQVRLRPLVPRHLHLHPLSKSWTEI
jgi:hypothetical protein